MKRIFAAVGALLALACLVAAVLTTIWIWSVRQPVAEKTARAFEKADDALTLAENTVENVRGNLARSRVNMQTVRATAPTGSQSSNFMQRVLARSAAKQVTPDINHVQHSLEKVTEASIVINSILGSLRDVDGVDKLDNEQVHDLQSKLNGVTQATLDLSDLLDAPGASSAEDAAERSERIANNLESVIKLIDSFQKGVQSLRKKVQYYKDKTHAWIEEGPLFVTIGLVWVMISQIAVLAVAVRAIRKPRPKLV